MELLQEFFNFVYGHLVSYGYFGIVVMMTLESSFILFPSEICMIPAGIEVANGNLNLYWAIFFGTLGSWIGSTINYVIAYFYGREFIEKYGKYVFLNIDKINTLDSYFKNHGKITVFIIRFIPVVRQYISFPAGLAKMNFWQFSLYTNLGAGIWVAVLALLGESFGKEFGAVFSNQQINFELMSVLISPHLNTLTVYAISIIALLSLVYIVFSKRYLQVKKSN